VDAAGNFKEILTCGLVRYLAFFINPEWGGGGNHMVATLYVIMPISSCPVDIWAKTLCTNLHYEVHSKTELNSGVKECNSGLKRSEDKCNVGLIRTSVCWFTS
jgi:hypothetical protein